MLFLTIVFSLWALFMTRAKTGYLVVTIIGSLWALLLVGSSSGLRPSEYFVAWFMWAIGLGPLALWIWLCRREVAKIAARQAALQAAHGRMLADAGVAPGAGSDHMELDTGIAINMQAQTLSLRVGGKSKTYPFADIRNWETIKETAGNFVGMGVQGALAAGQANNRARESAEAATGLFVTVRDIDNPKWRIAMGDANTQARWMEILRQSLNGS